MCKPFYGDNDHSKSYCRGLLAFEYSDETAHTRDAQLFPTTDANGYVTSLVDAHAGACRIFRLRLRGNGAWVRVFMDAHVAIANLFSIREPGI